MNKKAQEILPLLMLLGMMIGFVTFFGYYSREAASFSENPFFGQLGRREMHIIAMNSMIEGDLFILDMLGRYSLHDVVRESANELHILSPNCGIHLGIPVINYKSQNCLDQYDFIELSNSLSSEYNSKLYSRVLDSRLSFPFRYNHIFLQDGNYLRVSSYSESTVRYPLYVDDYNDADYRPNPRLSSEHISFDMSTQCTYLSTGRNNMPSDPNSQCEGNVCVAQCPDGINLRLVPYFNQCNLPGCNDRFCAIDYQNICSLGCGFKSLQMAYAYYDFLFDELQSRNTNNVLTLTSEMRNSKPNTIIESTVGCSNVVAGSNECYVDADYGVPTKINLAGHELMLVRALEITDEHYDKILESLDSGLVRLKLSLIGDCNPAQNELGYCIQQHYVLAIAGNEDFLVIHDPFTPNRNHRTGINVVVSREFIKESWTGYYRHIVGEQRSVA